MLLDDEMGTKVFTFVDVEAVRRIIRDGLAPVMCFHRSGEDL